MMITVLRFLSRPSVPIYTNCRHLSLSSNNRPFSASKTFSLHQERLTKGRFGVFLNVRSPMSLSSSPALSVEQVDGAILESKNDDHGGVIVEMTNQPLDPVVYASLLKASLSQWRQQGKKGIWIKLPIELVSLVEPTVKEGFYFHHAEPNYLMLVNWLPTSANTLPANASHRVGIGAFVLNEKNEVLVVQEKSGKFRGTGVWKFPTGVVDEGEDICDAAVREVKEETGIDTKFLEILAFSSFIYIFTGRVFFIHKGLWYIFLYLYICKNPSNASPLVQRASEHSAAFMMSKGRTKNLDSSSGQRQSHTFID